MSLIKVDINGVKNANLNLKKTKNTISSLNVEINKLRSDVNISFFTYIGPKTEIEEIVKKLTDARKIINNIEDDLGRLLSISESSIELYNGADESLVKDIGIIGTDNVGYTKSRDLVEPAAFFKKVVVGIGAVTGVAVTLSGVVAAPVVGVAVAGVATLTVVNCVTENQILNDVLNCFASPVGLGVTFFNTLIDVSEATTITAGGDLDDPIVEQDNNDFDFNTGAEIVKNNLINSLIPPEIPLGIDIGKAILAP